MGARASRMERPSTGSNRPTRHNWVFIHDTLVSYLTCLSQGRAWSGGMEPPMSRPAYEPTENSTQWGQGVTDILVVEDHLVVAEALSAMMNEELDMRVVGTAGTVEEGIRLARSRRPHVVLM